MKSFLLGEKQEQSQTFTMNGKRIPTTYIQTTPCFVIGFQDMQKQGYCAIKLGFQKTKHISKPQMGILKKAGLTTPLHFFKEFRLVDKKIAIEEKDGKKSMVIGDKKYTLGQELKPGDVFKIGQKIKVSAISKGKGFQGVVKRHGFKGGSRTHGQSDRERAPGSIGMTTTPGRVFKNKRMAGRMGTDRVTIQGIEVVDVKEKGVVLQGLIPGSKGTLVELRG